MSDHFLVGHSMLCAQQNAKPAGTGAEHSAACRGEASDRRRFKKTHHEWVSQTTRLEGPTLVEAQAHEAQAEAPYGAPGRVGVALLPGEPRQEDGQRAQQEADVLPEGRVPIAPFLFRGVLLFWGGCLRCIGWVRMLLSSSWTCSETS